jgi:hypothetical protein
VAQLADPVNGFHAAAAGRVTLPPNMRFRSALLGLSSFVLVAATSLMGCSDNTAKPVGTLGAACYADNRCNAELTCVGHVCITPGPGGTAPMDGGMDAGGAGGKAGAGGAGGKAGAGGASGAGGVDASTDGDAAPSTDADAHPVDGAEAGPDAAPDVAPPTEAGVDAGQDGDGGDGGDA